MCLSAQHKHRIRATLVDTTHTIHIKHEIDYINTTSHSINSIFLMDWANAFSDKSTPLAIRFAEDFRRAFQYAFEEHRGATTISKISTKDTSLQWLRPKGHPDVVEIKLENELPKKEVITISLQYKVKIPDARFTKFGVDHQEYKLKHWHLSPCAIINEKPLYYSHKNLNDFVASPDSYNLELNVPVNLQIASNLRLEKEVIEETKKQTLTGHHISNINLDVRENSKFYSLNIRDKKIVTDIPNNRLTPIEIQESILKTYQFATNYYGEFPQEVIYISYIDYLKQPVYGFTQLPKGFTPFKAQFKFEMIVLKELTKMAKSSHFTSNLRTNQWFTDAIQIHVLMKYIETYYPNEKLLGKLSKIVGIRWFHAAKLNFNDQYYLGYKNMPSRFLQQKLTLPKDSLLKFNYNISNPYKAGLGLNYLSHYDNAIDLSSLIPKFYNEQYLKTTNADDFLNILSEKASKDISWFEKDFLNTNEKVDVKIQKVQKEGDSIRVLLSNKGKAVPVKISSFSKKQHLGNQWISKFEDTTSITFARDAKYFSLDFEQKLPEANRRNNYWSRKSIFHKPLQLRLFQDFEDPRYHQTFVIPVYDFNDVDGVIMGLQFFNKELLYPRNFRYNITPSYGLNSNEIQGSGSISYIHQLKEYGWAFLSGGFSGQIESFAPGLQFLSYTPRVRLSYRPKDLRRNLTQSITARLVSIERESSATSPLETPNYRVLNTRYRYSDPNLKRVIGFNIDYQLANNFSKLSSTFGYRKLFSNNQWIDFRFFAGAFLFNNTERDGDFFSFALDRPTDYLFDFNYLTRADSGNFLSQQFINAEGNFKSRLTPRFANRWITTTSVETSIWNWIMAYGDVGLVKNVGKNVDFLYDSGIKLNLVQDYLEIYFPMQSSLGFEPSFDDYGNRIRFKFSLNLQTLIGLFTREWY